MQPAEPRPPSKAGIVVFAVILIAVIGAAVLIVIFVLPHKARRVTTTVTQSPPATTTSTSAMFGFTSDNQIKNRKIEFECKLDGEEWKENCVSGVTYNGLQTGKHSFAVRATKGSSKTEMPTSTYTWNVLAPAKPPVTSIISGPDPDSIRGTDAVFQVRSNVPNATFQCALDDADFGACPITTTTTTTTATPDSNSSPTSTLTFSGLALGEHSLVVRSVVAAGGGVEQSPPIFRWKVVPAPETPTPTPTPTGPAGCTACSRPGLYYCPTGTVPGYTGGSYSGVLISSNRDPFHDPPTAPITLSGQGYFYRQQGNGCF